MKKTIPFTSFNEQNRKKFKSTNDILYAVRALNQLLRGGTVLNNDIVELKVEEIKWPIVALNEHFKINYKKKRKKFHIGCIANLLVRNGYSVNKTKQFLAELFSCSDTHVRESYYLVKKQLSTGIGFAFIDYKELISLVNENIENVPQGYDGWLESLIATLEAHNSALKIVVK